MRGAGALAGLLAALAAPPAAAAPLPEPSYGLPRDVSADGHHIDNLIHFALSAIGLIFLVVFALLVWALIRHRAAHPAVYTHGSPASRRAVLLGVVAIFFLVDGSMFTVTVLDLHRHFWAYQAAEERPGALRVEVDAHQWSWVFRQPGPDGRFGTEDDVVTVDDLRVPVGVPVVLELTSNDVIHSLYLPNFRVKADAIPGLVNRLTFEAARPGEFEFGCAQHCGPNHYKMRGVLTAYRPAAYQDWLQVAAADARRAFDPDDADAHWSWEWGRYMR